MFRWLSIEGEGNHHLSFYKKLAGIMLLSMVLLLTAVLPFQGSTAYADGPKISIKTELGYKGNIKQDKWNPLKLVLTSDQDISGDIVFRVNNTYGMGQEAAYVQHVELPKDTPKEIIIGIPGYSYSKENNVITFYENSYKKGKPISFSTGRNYIEKSAMISAMVGVLSDDQDTMNFLNALNGKGSSLFVIPLKEEDISNDPMLLNGLDVLVINNFASDTLAQPKQESITKWVKSGGTLVLSGGAGYAKTAAPFEEIAPVKLNGTTTVESMPELQKLGGKPLKLDGEFTISTAEPVKDAVVDSQTAGVPLFASRNIEQGKVWYAAYDVAMEPVNSWGGHSDVWASVLRSELPLSANNVYYGSILDNLSNVLDYFPSITMPSFQMLMWMLIIYALVVAPVLYFILKKSDKREWAWFLIPLIAIVASGTVYMIGSADKTKEMAHTINIMELDGKGSAVKSTASAFFTPKSGDYELEFPKNTYLKTHSSFSAFGRGASENKNYIRVGEEQTNLELRDMQQWSVAKVWSENPVNEKTGQLKVDLRLDDKGQLAGKVTNETMNDLKEVVLVIGGKAHKIGDIARKSSADVPVSGKSVVRVMSGDLGNMLYPYAQNDPNSRQREVLDTYSYRSNNGVKDTFIFGWSEDHLTNYKLKGKEVQSDQLNFWVQPVRVDWNQNGIVNIPYGFLTPEVTQSNAPTFYVSPHGVELAQGTMIAEFPLMSELDAKYSEFSIKGTKLGGGMTMEIWNAADNAWEPIPDNNNVFTVKGNTDKYIVDKRIRFSVTAKDQNMFQMPELSLKGEVIK